MPVENAVWYSSTDKELVASADIRYYVPFFLLNYTVMFFKILEYSPPSVADTQVFLPLPQRTLNRIIFNLLLDKGYI